MRRSSISDGASAAPRPLAGCEASNRPLSGPGSQWAIAALPGSKADRISTALSGGVGGWRAVGTQFLLAAG